MNERLMNRAVLGLWVIAAIAASVSPILRHENNFEIFRSAWIHFVGGQDLYAASLIYYDLFKYTPSAALLFFPFAVLPFGLGLLVWNGVNAAALYWSLGRLLPTRGATIARAIVLPEMFGSLQSAQSNALIAALIILTFTELERRHETRAAFAVCIGTIVKIFPLAAVSFALLRSERRRFAVSCAIAGVTLVAAPLVLRRPGWLFHQYADWILVQRVDSGDPGFSVMALVRLWFGMYWPVWALQLAGVTALLTPVVRADARRAGADWRLRYVASVLIFCVIFNHQSEGPSFVIAMAGVGIWFALARRSWQRLVVLGFVLVFTVLTSSSLAPQPIRAELFDLRFKTVPMLVVWVVLQFELWRCRPAIPRTVSALVAPEELRAYTGGVATGATAVRERAPQSRPRQP